MKMFIIGIIALHAIIDQSNAQIMVVGVCPNIQAKADFDLHQYQGIWYEVKKYLFLPEIVGSCVYVRYKNFREEDATFEADIVHVEKLTRKHIVNPARGRLSNHNRTGQIDLVVDLRIPLSPVVVKVDYPYAVLDTDYRTYSIKWACRQIGIYNIQSMWILARTRTFSPETRYLVHQKLREVGLRPDLLLPSDQTNCPMPRE